MDPLPLPCDFDATALLLVHCPPLHPPLQTLPCCEARGGGKGEGKGEGREQQSSCSKQGGGGGGNFKRSGAERS